METWKNCFKMFQKSDWTSTDDTAVWYGLMILFSKGHLGYAPFGTLVGFCCAPFSRDCFGSMRRKQHLEKKLESERKQHLLTCQHIGFIVRSSSPLSTSVDMSRASQETKSSFVDFKTPSRWHIVSVWGDKTNLVVLKTISATVWRWTWPFPFPSAPETGPCAWQWSSLVEFHLCWLLNFISKYIKCRPFIHSLTQSFIHILHQVGAG
jgi:hypothetical protein